MRGADVLSSEANEGAAAACLRTRIQKEVVEGSVGNVGSRCQKIPQAGRQANRCSAAQSSKAGSGRTRAYVCFQKRAALALMMKRECCRPLRNVRFILRVMAVRDTAALQMLGPQAARRR